MKCTSKVRPKTFGVFFMQKRINRKFNLSEKPEVINDYQLGNGGHDISYYRKITNSMVKRWIGVY